GQDLKTLVASRLAEPIVEGDEAPSLCPTADPDERRRELEGVGRAERVDGEQSLGPVTNCRARKDLRPRLGERFEGSTRLLLARSPEDPVAPTPGEPRDAFGARRPPCDHRRICAGKSPGRRRSRLTDAERDDRGGVPE